MTVLTEEEGRKGEGVGYTRDNTMQRHFAKAKNLISLNMTERRENGTNAGYVRISEFNSLGKRKLKETIKSLEEKGANAYVLDLKSNPGGAFESTVQIAVYFRDGNIATSVVDNNDTKRR